MQSGAVAMLYLEKSLYGFLDVLLVSSLFLLIVLTSSVYANSQLEYEKFTLDESIPSQIETNRLYPLIGTADADVTAIDFSWSLSKDASVRIIRRPINVKRSYATAPRRFTGWYVFDQPGWYKLRISVATNDSDGFSEVDWFDVEVMEGQGVTEAPKEFFRNIESAAVFDEPAVQASQEFGFEFPLLTVTPGPHEKVSSISGYTFVGQSIFVNLADDGSNGDLVAGDGVYSLQLPPCEPYPLYRTALNCLYFKQLTNFEKAGFAEFQISLFIEYENGSFSHVRAVLPILRDDVELIDLQQLDESTYVTDTFVNIIDKSGLSFQGGFFDRMNMKSLANRFYERYPDNFDFLFFRSDRWLTIAGYGYYVPINIDFDGTGRKRFNFSALHGSAGRLKGKMFVNHLSLGPMVHELMHHWANQSALLEKDISGGHYGFSNVNGVLGGDVDFDTVTNLGNNRYQIQERQGCCSSFSGLYAPLELYMAGLLPKEEVPPVTLLSQPEPLEYNWDSTVWRSEKGIVTYTIDDIIAAEGERNPPFGEAQTDFRLGHVVVTKEPLDPRVATWLDAQIKYFGSKENDTRVFSAATGFRASMDVFLGEPYPNITD